MVAEQPLYVDVTASAPWCAYLLNVDLPGMPTGGLPAARRCMALLVER